MDRNRYWTGAFIFLGLGTGMALLLACQCQGCHQELPYNSNSPAAKIHDQKLVVPVVPGDDYVKGNLSFSNVMVDIYDRAGKKTMRCYTKPNRLTQVDRDDKDWDYTLELQFALEKSGKVFRKLTRSGDFEWDVGLNDLCTEDDTTIPDRIVVTKINVTRTPKPVAKPVPPASRPATQPAGST